MNFNELFGSVPDGWRSCTLGELVKEFGGGIQTGPFGSQLHAADYVENGIPSIMPKNIRIDGVDDSDIARVSLEDIERLSKYKVQTGDIVYSRRGDVEKCSLITELEDGWLCGTGCLRVRLQSKQISPEFLHAYLCHPYVREWIVRHAVGATMPNLNTSILSALPVLVPTSGAMNSITSNWSALSQKLVVNVKINQTLEQMAQAIFKSWFVDFDPVKAKMNSEQPEGMDAATASLFPEKLVESELGLIPDGWEVSSLGEHLDILETGKRPKGGVKGITEGVPSVGAENILGVGKYNYGKEKFIPDELFNKLKKGVIESEDVLIYKDGGKPGDFKPRFSMFGYGFPYEKFAINEHVFRIRSERLGQAYLYCQMQEPCVFNDLRNKGAKAAIPGINQKDVNSLLLVIPSDALLKEFNNLTSSIFKKILKNSLQSLELSRLRDTLLPKLLSGEINLDTTEELVEVN